MSEGEQGADSPFVGLRAYEEADRTYFFGRKRDQELIEANLYASRVTVLYGESGVGKSSVLQAGVVPNIKATGKASVVFFNEWQNTMEFLAKLKDRCLASANGKDPGGKRSQALDDILANSAKHSELPFIVVFDQFEEYFTYNPATGRDLPFEVEVARAINRPDVNAHFLFSLRNDGLAGLDRFRHRIRNLLSNTLGLPYLDTAGALAAICKPIMEFNQRFGTAVTIDGKPVVDLEEEYRNRKSLDFLKEYPLIALILREVRRRASSDEDVSGQAESGRREYGTAILQLVMHRLWKQQDARHDINIATLKGVDSLRQIAKTHIDEALGPAASPATQEQQASELIIDRLAPPGDSKIALPVKSLEVLADQQGIPRVPLQKVIERLSDPQWRILSPVPDNQVQISHDLLARPLREWRAEFLNLRAIEHATTAQLRTTLQVLAVVAFFLLGIGAGYYVWVQYQFRHLKLVQSLAANAYLQSDERLAALLARQAYVLNDEWGTNLSADIDRALRKTLSPRYLAETLYVQEGAIGALAVGAGDLPLLAAGCDDGTVRIWKSGGGHWYAEPISLLGEDVVTAIVASTDGNRFFVGQRNGKVLEWNLDDRQKPQRTIDTGTNGINALAVNKNATEIAVATMSGVVLLDLTTDPPSVQPLAGTEGERVGALAYGHTDAYLAVGKGSDVLLWDFTTGDRKVEPTVLRSSPEAKRTHKRWVTSLAFSPDDQRLVSGGTDHRAYIWDVTGESLPIELHSKANPIDWVTAVAFAPAGSTPRVAVASRDSAVRVWELDDHWRLRRTRPVILHGRDRFVNAVAFSQDGRRLISAGRDRTIRMWLLEGSPTTWELEHKGWELEHEGTEGKKRPKTRPINAFAVGTGTPPGAADPSNLQSWVVVARDDGQVEIWSPESPDKRFAVFLFENPVREFTALAISSAAHRLAIATDSTVSVWNLPGASATLKRETPDAQRTFDGKVTALAFSGSGDVLGVGSDRGVVRVWSTLENAAEPVTAFESQNKARITSLALNRNGKLVAAATEAGRVHQVHVLDMKATPPSNRELRSNARVMSVSFSPDELSLAAGSKDGVIRLWPISAFAGEGRELVAHGSSVNAIAFSPDGKQLAAGGGDRMVRVWRLDRDENLPESVLRGHKGFVRAVAFTADGKFVMAGGSSKVGIPRVWIAGAGTLAEMVCGRVGHHDLTNGERASFMERKDYRPCILRGDTHGPTHASAGR